MKHYYRRRCSLAKRLEWLKAHRELWWGRGEDANYLGIVRLMRRDGLIAPTTHDMDCRVDLWLAALRTGQGRELKGEVTHE